MAYRPPQPNQQQYGAGQNPPFVAQQAAYEQQRQQQQQVYEQQRQQQQTGAYSAQAQAAGAPSQVPAPRPTPLPTDYVYFERSPHGFRKDTLEKAQAAKLKLEHFYQKAVQEAIERNGRSVLRCGELFGRRVRGGRGADGVGQVALSCFRSFFVSCASKQGLGTADDKLAGSAMV
jgi:hypothetical protein